MRLLVSFSGVRPCYFVHCLLPGTTNHDRMTILHSIYCQFLTELNLLTILHQTYFLLHLPNLKWYHWLNWLGCQSSWHTKRRNKGNYSWPFFSVLLLSCYLLISFCLCFIVSSQTFPVLRYRDVTYDKSRLWALLVATEEKCVGGKVFGTYGVSRWSLEAEFHLPPEREATKERGQSPEASLGIYLITLDTQYTHKMEKTLSKTTIPAGREGRRNANLPRNKDCHEIPVLLSSIQPTSVILSL